jgi:hypothetical protein
MQPLEETNLAWALAEAAKPYLNAVERNDVYTAIGVGETSAAIGELIATAAAKRIPLRSDLIDVCRSWLDIYVGHENERYLRDLVDCVVAPYAIRSR